MNDFEKIEHLLLSKKFEELNPSEMKEVQGYFENATDYNDMRDTLMHVKSTLAADKLLIKPSVDLKEKLLQQFENTYSNTVNKSAGKTRPFYRKMAFQWSAAASVVIILSVSAVTYFNSLNKNSKEMAVNYDKKDGDQSPAEEKSNFNTETVAATDSTSVVISNPDENETNTGFNAPVGSTTEDVEESKSEVLGNMSNNEVMVKEGERNEENIPVNNGDELNKSTTKDSKIDDKRNPNKTEQSRDDANFYYNDALKSKEDKTTKTLELDNTNIPTNNVNTVNEKNRSTNNTDYWSKKKQNQDNKDKGEVEKQATDNIQIGGYMSVNQMVQTDKKDSTEVKLDSLKTDSSKINLQGRESSIDTDKKPQKDN